MTPSSRHPRLPAATPASGAPARPHFAGLDGLRALAVVAVIVYHLFPGALRGGFLGVDLFFVISGFLITRLLLDERAGTGTISLTAFWRRRARRILPAIAVLALVCTSLAGLIGGDLLVGIGRQLLGLATFSSNWFSIAAGSSYFDQTAPELFRNLWSLGVEEQFYLLWPIALLGLAKLPRRGFQLGVIGIAAVASAIAMAALYAPGADPTRVYFGSDTHSFGLALGAVLAIGITFIRPFHLDEGESALQRLNRVHAPWVGVLALVGLVWMSTWLEDAGAFAYRGGIVIGTVLAALVVWAATLPGARLGRLLDARPLRWLGRRSYGLYLWHWPALILVDALIGTSAATRAVPALPSVLALIATLVAAVLSYRFVEEPIRRHGLRAPLTLSRIAFGRAHRGIGVAVTAWVLLVASLAGTGAAVAAAPEQTSAQRVIERGARALAAASASPSASASAPVATTAPSPTAVPAPLLPAPSASPTPSAPDSATPTASPGSASGSPTSSATGSATPTESAVPSPEPLGATVSAVGDSVMLASAPELQLGLPALTIDAAVSRQLSAAPDIVRALAATGGLRETLVIGLGTNGAIELETLEEIRDLIGPNRRIVVVSVYAARPWTDEVNATLRAFDQAHRNVALADWSTAIAPHPDLLADDGIHPGPTGGQIYTDCILAALSALPTDDEVAADAAQGLGAFRR
ncbi:acyltransferase family protein [Microbacteriaceae bacterium VKM Ac-2854]|nr:acyltransferase family protein [Microbacteriaceae bacterium VKM Ac-2854]